MDKPREQRVSKAKTKARGEISIHEATVALGFGDSDEEHARLFDYLRMHHVKWRRLDTKHGPMYYFNGDIINDLREVMLVNKRRIAEERRQKEIDAEIHAAMLAYGILVPSGTNDDIEME